LLTFVNDGWLNKIAELCE